MRQSQWKEHSWVSPLHLQNYYQLSGEICAASCDPLIEWILFHNSLASSKKPGVLYLIIDSDGGDTSSAFSVSNFIRSSNIPVHTLGTGIVGSAALLIFMAGKCRTLLQSTSILSHQFSWSMEGKYHDLESDHHELKNVQDRMLECYKTATGMPARTISKHLLPAGNRWLTAKEALEYKLCDEVVDMIDISNFQFIPR